MRVLITGGAGFIGSNLARKFLELGHKVRVLDNFSSGKEDNLDEIIDDIELIEGDIRDFWTVSKAVKNVDAVSHQAALPSVPRSVENPLTSNAVNIDGTLNILESSRLSGVKKLVFASSSSVYGESVQLPKHEKMEPSPLSPYAITKLTGEYYCRVYWNLYQFPTVSLRYFNIFGPRQDPKSEYAPVIPRFISLLNAGSPPVIYGDGEQTRDFTYIDNAVEANLLAIESDSMNGDVYNVACGAQYSLNELVSRLNGILGVAIKATNAPARHGDIRHSYAEVTKLKKLGYKAGVSFEDGLQRTTAFFTGQQTIRTHVPKR